MRCISSSFVLHKCLSPSPNIMSHSNNLLQKKHLLLFVIIVLFITNTFVHSTMMAKTNHCVIITSAKPLFSGGPPGAALFVNAPTADQRNATDYTLRTCSSIAASSYLSARASRTPTLPAETSPRKRRFRLLPWFTSKAKR